MVFLWFVALLPPVPMSPLLPGAVVPASFAFNVICGGFKGVQWFCEIVGHLCCLLDEF